MAEYTVKEKMEHAIAEAAASFMTNEYVVKGAQLKCTLGSAPSLLNLPLCHGFYATGHPIIHSMDNKPMVNILPFGTCPVLGGPCVPAPVGPWLNAHEKTMIADAAPGGPLYPAVTMKSFLVCALGGLIEPKKSGQEYKTPGSSTTDEGKAPANTGRYDESPKKPAGRPFAPSENDWRFFEKNGNEFDATLPINIDEIEGQFGEDRHNDIAFGTLQEDVDMWLVDRIARTLYEEYPYCTFSMDFSAWNMFNAMYQNRHADGSPFSLYEVLTAHGDNYEAYGIWGANYNIAVNPKGNTENFAYYEDGWNHALDLAKKLVSVACNPYIVGDASHSKKDKSLAIEAEHAAKKAALKTLIPCPYDKEVFMNHPQVKEVKGADDWDPDRFIFHIGASRRSDAKEGEWEWTGWGPKYENLKHWIKVGDDGSCPVSSFTMDDIFQAYYYIDDDESVN